MATETTNSKTGSTFTPAQMLEQARLINPRDPRVGAPLWTRPNG